MTSKKTRVLTVRVEEGLYKELQKQAKKRGGSVAQYTRELIYSFHYPTGEILGRLEENKNKLDYSIENAREYLGRLIVYSDDLKEAITDFEKKIDGGAIQFPLKEREAQGEK